VVAATLANGGVCPITNKTVLKPENVLHVRSLMYSCGMYTYSGQFAFTVSSPIIANRCDFNDRSILIRLAFPPNRAAVAQ
jgi:hypothetical protein